MITLFDQEYAVEAYAREKMKAGEARGEARGAIKEAIKIYHDDLHLSPMMVLQKIDTVIQQAELMSANMVA